MNRSPWGAVLGAVLVLVATTLCTYVPWRRLAPPVARLTSSTWAEQTARARAWYEERLFLLALRGSGRAAPLPLPGGVPVATAALVALAAAIALVMWRRRARRPRPLVLELAARGEATSEIARRTGLPQDAVRLLLSPMLDPAASEGRTGMSFRSRAAATAGRAPRDPVRRGAT